MVLLTIISIGDGFVNPNQYEGCFFKTIIRVGDGFLLIFINVGDCLVNQNQYGGWLC